jgi:hypothetical protein
MAALVRVHCRRLKRRFVWQQERRA